MRPLSHFFLGLSIVGLLLSGCEKHHFEDTKVLHGGHGHHGDESGDHGDGHGDDAKSGEKAGEKRADSAPEEAPAAEAKKEKKQGEPRDVGL